jgi:hypothetical protein
MFHAKYNHHTGTYALDGNAAPIKTSWHEYSEKVRIHMINSRVICRNHAKEFEFRTLCWNYMCLTLDTVPMSGSAVLIIWIA